MAEKFVREVLASLGWARPSALERVSEPMLCRSWMQTVCPAPRQPAGAFHSEVSGACGWATLFLGSVGTNGASRPGIASLSGQLAGQGAKSFQGEKCVCLDCSHCPVCAARCAGLLARPSILMQIWGLNRQPIAFLRTLITPGPAPQPLLDPVFPPRGRASIKQKPRLCSSGPDGGRWLFLSVCRGTYKALHEQEGVSRCDHDPQLLCCPSMAKSPGCSWIRSAIFHPCRWCPGSLRASSQLQQESL